MGSNVRRLGPDDVGIWRTLRLEALSRYPENFLTTYADEKGRDDETRALMLAKRRVFCAFINELPVGTIAFDPETNPTETHRASINAVYLRDTAQGSGAAQLMLDHVIKVARQEGFVQMELCVAVENARAIRFYERNGFRQWGRLPRSVKLPDRYQDDLFYYLPLDH